MYWKFAVGFKGTEREIEGQEEMFVKVITWLGGTVSIDNPITSDGDKLSVFTIETEE